MNPLTSLLGAMMASPAKNEKKNEEHIADVADRAHFRLEDDQPALKKKGHQKHQKYSNAENAPEVPRRYIKPSHSDTKQFDTYAANSYESAIAISQLMKEREL